MEWVHVLSTVALGVFAGSLLMEGALLVPYWRTLSFAEFTQRHGDFGPRLFVYFFPVTNAAVWLSIGSAAVDGLTNGYRNAAAVLCIAALATFFLYFKNANAAFAEKRVSAEDLPGVLKLWATWHWARTVATLLAFASAVLALS